MSKIQIISLIISLLLMLVIFQLIRKRKLKEQYSLLWFLTVIIMLSGMGVALLMLATVTVFLGPRWGMVCLPIVAVLLGFLTSFQLFRDFWSWLFQDFWFLGSFICLGGFFLSGHVNFLWN